MDEITSADQLCYEVWVEYADEPPVLASAYWDVMTAWRVMLAITQTEQTATDVKIIVANGMSYHHPAPGFPPERMHRKDVI